MNVKESSLDSVDLSTVKCWDSVYLHATIIEKLEKALRVAAGPIAQMTDENKELLQLLTEITNILDDPDVLDDDAGPSAKPIPDMEPGDGIVSWMNRKRFYRYNNGVVALIIGKVGSANDDGN